MSGTEAGAILAEHEGSRSRPGTIVVGLLAGIVFGAVGTVAHQSTISIAGLDLPWGVVVALLGATALLVGLRLVLEDRWTVGACAVGLLGTIVLLSLKSVGGSVLVPDGVTGLVWTIGSAGVAALVIAWPRLPQRVASSQHA